MAEQAPDPENDNAHVGEQDTVRTPSPLSSAHWSKDFVEHLRLVHFALGVVSVAVIAVSSAHGPSEYDRARNQLNDIRALRTRLNPKTIPTLYGDELIAIEQLFAEKLQAAEPIVSEDDPAPLSRLDRKGGVQARLSSKELRNGGLDVIFGTSTRRLWRDYYEQFADKDPKSQAVQNPFDTLAFFRNFWNGFRSHESFQSASWLRRRDVLLVVPIKRSEQQTITDIDHAKLVGVSAAMEKSAHGELVGLDLDLCGPRLNELLARLQSPTCKWVFQGETNIFHPGKGDLVLLPLATITVHIGLQDTLTGLMGGRNLHAGSFEDSFPDLADVAKGFEDLPLGAVDTVLREFGKRTDAFQFAEIKFPVEQTVLWGVIVLIAIEIYLWIHLRQFITRFGQEDPGWEVAWIGIYGSTPARVVVFTSLVILPALAMIYTGWRSLGAHRFGALAHPVNGDFRIELFVVLGVALSVTVSCSCWHCLVKVREIRAQK